MPRPKGPGTIKFLDATKQDDVAMRRRLWRGAPGDTPLEEKLNDLYRERAKLTVQLIDLRTLREGLRRVVSGENPTMKKFKNPPMLRANAKMELPGVMGQGLFVLWHGSNPICHLDSARGEMIAFTTIGVSVNTTDFSDSEIMSICRKSVCSKRRSTKSPPVVNHFLAGQ